MQSFKDLAISFAKTGNVSVIEYNITMVTKTLYLVTAKWLVNKRVLLCANLPTGTMLMCFKKTTKKKKKKKKEVNVRNQNKTTTTKSVKVPISKKCGSHSDQNDEKCLILTFPISL